MRQPKYSTIIAIVVSVFSLYSISLWGMEPVDTLSARMDLQRYVYPQEKINVTTDKEHYMAGDTIWLRAFVVDASSHCPVDVSRYVYVELRNPFNQVEYRAKLISCKGEFCGYLPLDAKMAEGRFMLTAYTMFMENAGEEYFFKKQVTVSSAFSTKLDIPYKLINEPNGIRKVQIEYNDRENGKHLPYGNFVIEHQNGRRKQFVKGNSPQVLEIDPDDRLLLVEINDEIRKYIDLRDTANDSVYVSLHPEGGYIIPGKACKVGFKAIGSDGLGRDVTGQVVDSQGNVVSTLKSLHRGMGYFTIAAQEGEVYTVRFEHNGEQCATMPLPKANEDAKVLHVSRSRHGSVATIEAVGTTDGIKCNIAVQERGILLSSGAMRTGECASIDLDCLPQGVIQVLLLDDAGDVLSERLLFNSGKAAYVSISADKRAYSSRECVTVDVSFGTSGVQAGSFAVSVTDDNTVQRDSTVTILSNLLLQSDLRGYIEDAAWYFTNAENSLQALDALMLTQGWRRYDIPQVLKGIYKEPQIPIERGQEISGTVKSLWRGKPIADTEVNIIAPNRMFYSVARTDSIGRFYLNGFDLPDGTKYVVQALNRKKKNEMNFTIDEAIFPSIGLPSAIRFSPIRPLNSARDNSFISNEYARLNIDGSMSVLLNELVVNAKKKIAVTDAFTVLAHRSYDYKDFSKQAISSYEEVLRKFAGITVEQGNVYYRHKAVGIMIDGSFFENTIAGYNGTMPSYIRPQMSANGPVYTKDNLGAAFSESNNPVNINDIEMVAPFSIVKQIDFVMPNDAVFLGPRASGGVIRIITKDGTEIENRKLSPNFKAIIPLGYQKPAQFYSPRYEFTTGSDGSDLRSTVYWNPSVKIGANGRSHFTFYTTDAASSSYTITIEGITSAGEIIHATNHIPITLR